MDVSAHAEVVQTTPNMSPTSTISAALKTMVAAMIPMPIGGSGANAPVAVDNLSG